MAARLAAENAGALDLANMRAVLHDLEEAFAAGNRDLLRHFTGEFQLAMFKSAHNDFLHDLVKSLLEKIRNQRASTIRMPGRDSEVVAFCRDLLQAIEKRDPDTCERLARGNRRRTLELRLKMMRSAPPSA
jgi:DNA-binding GntR family transcriptional regulator